MISSTIKKLVILLSLGTAIVNSGQGNALTLTDASAMNPLASLIDFENFSTGVVSNPLTIGDATFSSDPGLTVLSIAGLPVNGTEVNNNVLHPRPGGFDSGPYTPLSILFSKPVSEVGLGWLDPNLPGNVLRAFNSNNVLLEDAAVALGPPGGCCAAFIGIRRPTAEIARIEVVPAATNDVYAIDNVRFFATPEPGTLFMLGTGLLSLVCVGWWRQRKGYR